MHDGSERGSGSIGNRAIASLLVDARWSWASGIGRYIGNTLPLVALDLPEVAFEVLVLAVDAERAHIACGGAPNITVTVTKHDGFSFAGQWCVHALAKRHDLTWFANYWVPVTFRRPFVVTIHDLLHLEARLFPTNVIKRGLAYLTFAHLARKASGILYVSRFTRREFERRFGTPRDGTVSRLGADHKDWKSYDPLRPVAKERRILLVAAPKHHKNFEIAVSAFNGAQIASDWTLTLVLSQKGLRSSIDVELLVRDAHNIDLKTGLSNEVLQDLYAKSAILLMPSLYEGFGLPLIEGLQAGSTCIASTAESLVEVGQGAAVDWVNGRDLEGWIKAIESATHRWDTGTVDRAALIGNMRHAESFRWADVARQTSDLLRRVLETQSC